jgi:hypothetical protein
MTFYQGNLRKSSLLKCINFPGIIFYTSVERMGLAQKISDEEDLIDPSKISQKRTAEPHGKQAYHFLIWKDMENVFSGKK